MKDPRVSFVIPVRNDASRLRQCLASITRNDYPGDLVQVIVVDNGSTDGSAQVASLAGARVVRIDQGGVSALRNLGAATASGDIIAFVDADHLIDSDWIRQAVTTLKYPNVAAAGAPCVAPPRATWVQARYDTLRSHPHEIEDVDWLGSGNLAVKRAVFTEVGGFDTSLETCEDVDLCFRIRKSGRRILSNPRMWNMHLGDPATLKALFFGELWRGRGNWRVTLRGPRTIRNFRSLIIPMAGLALLPASLLAAATGHVEIAAVAAAIGMAPTLLRAGSMIRRDPQKSAVTAVQAMAVALVYDAARALALVARGSHGRRRSFGDSVHVAANSHS